VFAGGETLLGKEYWEVARWLADNVPDPKQLTLCFQTNGTQKIHKRYYDLIEQFHLVKLQISLDGTKERFEYLRWPASWNKTTDNILDLKTHSPSNVMFTIEETISIFNLYYQQELAQWAKENFTTNREGDEVNHTRHLALGIFNLNNITEEYNQAIGQKYNKKDWQENPEQIQKMIKEIAKFDQIRKQDFVKTFPEIAHFYKRYL
jgi:MoaA/NifB/PqqE/SkfB family radical SAM enzyme